MQLHAFRVGALERRVEVSPFERDIAGDLQHTADADDNRRPARTVHCSVPRHTPAAPSKTPRLVYFPIPRTTCSELSRACAIVQIFSVHDGSDWLTVANVSTI